MKRSLAIFALAVLLIPAAVPSRLKAEPLACPKLYPGGTVAFTGLYPAIEKRLPRSTFKPGMIVEIDVTTMSEAAARDHIAELLALPARVSVYLPGGHCYVTTDDCKVLQDAGVRVGPTGSWNWDNEERRIYDVAHPAVVARLKAGAETGWRLGANYIRIDNLHHPAGSSEPRTAAMMKVVFDAIHDVEDELRRQRAIRADQPTGVVAHNNLHVWEEMLRKGMLRRPPVFLTSERTSQLAYKDQGYKGETEMKQGKLRAADNAEITSGRLLAQRLGVPYTIAEFRVSHDLASRKGTTYRLPTRYVDELKALAGVTEVIVIANETSYVGRGTVYTGTGPRSLAAAPLPDGANRIASECLRK